MTIPLSGCLLFQGDSITDAFRQPGEINDAYRLGNGYAFIIGSLLRATSGKAGLSVQNRGVSGHNVSDLLFRWQRDCLELRPDALSLLIGTNDAGQIVSKGRTLSDFTENFDTLLAQTMATLPHCRLILLEPFALPINANMAAYGATLKPIQAHVRSCAARTNAIFVPLQQAFNEVSGEHPERWIYDGIHPTAAGHWLIAQSWLATVAGIHLPSPVSLGS